jgi:hypothetical protein
METSVNQSDDQPTTGKSKKGEPFPLSREDMAKLQGYFLDLAEWDMIMCQILHRLGLRADDDSTQEAVIEAIEQMSDEEGKQALIEWINARADSGIPILPEWTGKEIVSWMGTSAQRVFQIQDEAFAKLRIRAKQIQNDGDPKSYGPPTSETIRSFTTNDETTQ